MHLPRYPQSFACEASVPAGTPTISPQPLTTASRPASQPARQTDSQADTQSRRHADSQAQTDTETQTQTHRHTDTQTDRQTDGQTDTHTHTATETSALVNAEVCRTERKPDISIKKEGETAGKTPGHMPELLQRPATIRASVAPTMLRLRPWQRSQRFVQKKPAYFFACSSEGRCCLVKVCFLHFPAHLMLVARTVQL